MPGTTSYIKRGGRASLAWRVLFVFTSLTSPTTASVVKNHHIERTPQQEVASLPQSLQKCLSETGVSVLYPQSEGYSTAAQSQNTNYDYRPAAIIQPASVDETSKVVTCVAEEDGRVKLSSFGGGHGYAAYALGGANGYVVIANSKLQDIKINASNKTVTVGAGQHLGPLAEAIGKQGFALPHGTCPSVGVVGHALGGGWGFSSRKWGWLMDHIVGITYVDPTGSIHHISEQNQEDGIWWAMRGAGANNFGAVTSLTFALEDAPSEIVNFKTWFYKNEDCAQALLMWQELGSSAGGSASLPAEFGAQLLPYGEGTGNTGACRFLGQYLGPMHSFSAIEALIRDDMKTRGVEMDLFNTTKFSSWTDALTNIMGNLNSPQVKVPYYAQSLVDDGSPDYTLESAMNIMLATQVAANISNGLFSISFDLDGPLSGTNGEQPHSDSALAAAGKRKALFLSQIYSENYPSFNETTVQSTWNTAFDGVNTAVRASSPNDQWRAYVNYLDPRLTNWAEMYYGDALDRLIAIKKRVDPNTIFDFPQGLAHA